MNISVFSSQKDTGIHVYTDRLLHDLEKIDSSLQIQLVTIEKGYRIHHNLPLYVRSRKLFKQLGKEMNHADIAHIQHEYSLFCLWTNPLENMYGIFRKQIHIPTVITVHEVEKRKQSKSRIKRFIKIFYYILLKRYLDYVNRGMFAECEAIIVHTKEARDELCSRNIPEEKIHIIAHGIPDVKKSTNSKEANKKKIGAAGKRVLLSYGYISHRKGQDLVIDILDQLPNDVVYVLAGEIQDREYGDMLMQTIREKKLTKRVIFLGHILDRDVADIMSAADIYVYTARNITASGVISEGIAYGLPIIAPDLQFITEINQEVACIQTYPVEDKKALLQGIRSMLEEDTNVYQRALEEYKNMHSYYMAAQKTDMIYHDLYNQYYAEVS